MSNNTLSWRRFQLLFNQHLIHNGQLLLLSLVAYVGVIFIVLSIAQFSNGLRPHDLDMFRGFLVGFVTLFALLYVGHSFPAFRSKESTISYLMVPASTVEKFIFEFVIRILFVLVALPLVYWLTFHLHGFFFTIFTDEPFLPVGIQYLVKIDIEEQYYLLIYSISTAGVLLTLSLVFTGAAMFDKQPLVKTLFVVAIAIMFFVGYSFIMMTQFGLEKYTLPQSMYLVPLDEVLALKLAFVGLTASALIMLFVAYRKLKEREV